MVILIHVQKMYIVLEAYFGLVIQFRFCELIFKFAIVNQMYIHV